MSQGREKRTRRSRLSRLLGRLNPVAPTSRESEARRSRAERLYLETLEQRQLLAGDVSIVSADTIGPIEAQADVAPIVAQAFHSNLTTQTAAEGESAPDLVQFAKDLDSAGVVFFGANWCPACSEQKQLFQDGSDDLPFVEVTNPDRSIGQIGIDNNITAYPTWVFPDQSRETGVLTLQQLSDRSGVAIPQGETPTFEELGDQTVLIGSPLHVPVDAYDPDGGPLTVTVSVSDPTLLDASLITGNRSILINMNGYGDMIFELFEQRAPVASGRVIELAEAGFYDDIIFHRVIDDFVIQAGDPTGTGTSGSTLPDFDDDFHPELQHNRKGVLSFAKSSDDTNNSQFFVTEVPTRFLDFNHSIFGQLIEGEDVRDAISEHAVNGADRPTTDISINTIDVFTDTENSLIMLKPTGNGIGSTNVTVTVTDGDGNTHSETFQVDVNNDTQNGQPFLNEVAIPNAFTPGTPANLQVSSTDVEGDAVSYSSVVTSTGTGATASIDQNGLLTVTPANGFTGIVDVQVTVRPGPGVVGNGGSDSDNQLMRFNFEGEQTLSAPTSIDLSAGSDSGSSDSDNITNAGSLAFVVDGVTSGATVQLINQQTSAVLGEAIATGTSVTVTTNNLAALGDGVYNVTARQVFSGLISDQSTPVTVTFDTTDPSSVISSANTRGNVGRLYQTDLINSEEGSIVYALTQFPTGATINSGSGLIQWTPDANDVGDNAFTVTTTDLAGNTRTENFAVTISDEPKAEVSLVIKDLNGNEITSLNVGDEFVLELIGVDARSGFDRDGVFAIYTDILFDSTIVQPKAGTTIEYVGDFTLSPKGSFSAGLIDELGAASTRTVASNEDESLIVRVQMVAIGTGSVNIRSEEADEASSEILLYGDDNQISADAVLFGNVNLTVGIDFTLTDDTITVAEDSGATTIDVLANDTNSGSGSLSVITVTQPASGGTVSVDSGVVSFTPSVDFNGTAEFTYRAGDGSGAQDTATVTVTVTPVNDPPTGVADSFDVVEGSAATRLDVLANDSISPDTGETLTVTAVDSNTANVTVEISSDGSAVDYTPVSGFTGTDTFTYTVSDGVASETVTVTVTVVSADNPPTAVDDSFTINEDTAEASYDILQNDTSDGESESFLIDSVGIPSNGGSVRISADGSTFFYEPAADFFGTETVTYTIRDTGGGIATGLVTFTVTGVNDPAPVVNDTVQLGQGVSETTVLRIEDLPTNVDGTSETLSFVLTTPQQTSTEGGSVSIDGGGNLTYTPPSDSFTGTDTVTYSVSDGSGTDSVATLTIEVTDLTQRNILVNFSGSQAQTFASSVRLTGTDALGNAVSATPELDSSNNLVFQDVLPGEYVVEIPAVPFFSGAEQAQQYAVSSAPEDGDTVVDATMGRLRPEFLSLQDWLGSTPAQSVLVAIEPGESALLTEPSSLASESITDPVLELNDAGTELTITGQNDEDPTDTDGPDTITAAVLVSQGDIIQPRGQIGDLRLYRVNVADDVVNYNRTPLSITTGATTGGEGESTGLSASATGEGESTADAVAQTDAVAGATSVADVAAPLLSNHVIEAVLASESESDDDSETGRVDAVITQPLSRRQFTSSASNQVTPQATTSDHDLADTEADDESAQRSGSIESSSLSARRVDGFFRRGL